MLYNVMFKGYLVEVLGDFFVVGDKVFGFCLVVKDLVDVLLVDFIGKCKIFNIFFSVDMLVCVVLVCYFNQDVVGFVNMVVLCILVDLLFVQVCFCGVEGLDNVVMLLILCGVDFFKYYGVVLVSGLLVGLVVCVVVVLDEYDYVKYVELVLEIIQELDYDVVLVSLC